MVRSLGKAPWWAWSVLSVAVVLVIVVAVAVWPRAEAQYPNPDPWLVVYLSAANYTVGEAAGSVTLTVVLSAASSEPVTVDYATQDGTAVPASCLPDYRHTEGTLVFAPGQTAQTIVIQIFDDTFCEPTETFTVSLFNPQGASLGNPTTSTITILDDEVCP